MERKRWTAKAEVDDAVLSFREKRKWQIALRRYVLERNKSSAYAPYFSLSIEKFRGWIEIQFDGDLNWDNFSKAWQLDHIVPVAYFDFSEEQDLRLCWNFTNIRVAKHNKEESRRSGIDVLAAKKYFEFLYEQTGYSICLQMVEKILRIETAEIANNVAMKDFISSNQEYITTLQAFNAEDYDKLNTGTELKAIVFEKDFHKRWS